MRIRVVFAWIALALLGSLSLQAVAVACELPPRVLVVLTGVARVPGTDRETGFWAEEFVVPCDVFRKAGLEVVTATVSGGLPPVDQASLNPATIGQEQASAYSKALEALQPLLRSAPLREVNVDDYAAVFVVGGHGVMWDLADSADMHRVAREALEKGRVLSAVCHGPSALVKARSANGSPLLRFRQVTGFSNAEEQAAQMASIVPFSLQDRLDQASNGRYESGPAWQSKVVEHGRLITGQNPASSAATAEAVVRLVELLRSRKR